MFDPASKKQKQQMVAAEKALPGRDVSMPVPQRHFVSGRTMLDSEGKLDCPQGYSRALFGLGCFWGAERKFWQRGGVYLTAVGYAGGYTPNPAYEEVCSGLTGHNEVVALVFDPKVVSYAELLGLFWESHNPTQGMRQGNDIGTQYRSGIYCYGEEQRRQAEESMQRYQRLLGESGLGVITTEIRNAPVFYFAEDYHQQYLAKNPGGYCGLGGTGVDYR